MHTDDIWKLLEEINDPEVPVLSIIDLGIVRDVLLNKDSCEVTITPTYTGCPAMKVIEEEIVNKISNLNISVQINTTLSPAWTTDWISTNGRKKLEHYGIAPPQNEPDKAVLFSDPPVIPCPKCKSKKTKLISQFGSTACKAHYQCITCFEPFDYFKCLK
jgi:ring-1,2-phenylacetyl-CoA epoxidase subunit PaaD